MIRYKQDVANILEMASPYLNSVDVENAEDLLKHDEWGEAYLLICSQIYEKGQSIPSQLYAQIEQAGRKMNLDEKEWVMLSAQIIDNH